MQIIAGKKRGILLKFDLRLYLFLAFVVFASTILAQTSGTFTPTGNMTTARFLPTATLLADGRVLITGGGSFAQGSFHPLFHQLPSAELYNPSAGAFTPTGNMTVARGGATATLLRDGRVLIAGGNGNDGKPIASAELYDPNTGTFTPTGSLTTARASHTATLLADGRVLTAGGWNSVIESLLTSAEIYDPSTGTFTATGDMNRPWADTATLLPSGKVLVTKGNPDDGPYLSSAELYDPSTGTFASAGYMNANHTGPTATLLPSGKVLVAGGNVSDDGPSSYIAELYDSATGTFTTVGNMITGREQHTATLLSDGTVLMAGGYRLSAAAEVYNPVTSTFATTGNMITRRELHAATLLNDGRVLLAGGDGDTILASAELYTSCSVNIGPTVPPDPWQGAIARMKAVAGTDCLNFWQWAYYWQNTPTFAGAPNGFGVGGSISPDVMDQITKAGGGDVLLITTAEQWVQYFRQVAPTN